MSKDPIPLDIRLHESVRFFGAHWKVWVALALALLVLVSGVIISKYREAQRTREFAEAFDEAMRAEDRIAALSNLEKEYADSSGGEWIRVEHITALAEKKDWNQALEQARSLTEFVRDPDLQAFARFLAAACAENAGKIDEAQAFLKQIMDGKNAAYALLARLERAQLLAAQGDTSTATAEVKEMLEGLKGAASPAEAGIKRRAEDLFVWISIYGKNPMHP
jgi:hypothetical protein